MPYFFGSILPNLKWIPFFVFDRSKLISKIEDPPVSLYLSDSSVKGSSLFETKSTSSAHATSDPVVCDKYTIRVIITIKVQSTKIESR